MKKKTKNIWIWLLYKEIYWNKCYLKRMISGYSCWNLSKFYRFWKKCGKSKDQILKLPKVQKKNKEKDDLEQRNYWKKIHDYTIEKYKR